MPNDSRQAPPPAVDTTPGFRMAFDWIDLLILLAIVGAYMAVVAPRFGSLGYFGAKAMGGLFLAALVARRGLFGMPARGPLRRGFFWSLAGIGTLVLLIGGLGSMALAAQWFEQSREPAPDVTAEANRLADDEAFPSLDFALPGEVPISPAEKAEQARRAHDASVQKYIEEQQADWKTRQSDARAGAWKALLCGVLLFALGVAADGARYARLPR